MIWNWKSGRELGFCDTINISIVTKWGKQLKILLIYIYVKNARLTRWNIWWYGEQRIYQNWWCDSISLKPLSVEFCLPSTAGMCRCICSCVSVDQTHTHLLLFEDFTDHPQRFSHAPPPCYDGLRFCPPLFLWVRSPDSHYSSLSNMAGCFQFRG